MSEGYKGRDLTDPSSMSQSDWYNNQQLFEMMQGLRTDILNYREEMRKYNGLKEDNVLIKAQLEKLEFRIDQNEDAPCKKMEDWAELKALIQRLGDQVVALKVTHEARVKLKEFLITWGGWVVMIVGFIAKIVGWW